MTDDGFCVSMMHMDANLSNEGSIEILHGLERKGFVTTNRASRICQYTVFPHA